MPDNIRSADQKNTPVLKNESLPYWKIKMGS